MRTLIVTADDFGAGVEINEAVERGHRDGILTAASLMVTGRAAADAIERAKRMPALGVGLHLVLVEGQPALPPGQVPDLVGRDGAFRTDMARLGAEIFFRHRVRRQAATEIDAQFAAFAATGLPLDHVNAHKHFHLHPTIAALILEIGARYGLTAVRAPIEPGDVLNAIEPGTRIGRAWVTAPWAKLLRRRLRRDGLTVPDQVFGLAWSGAMTTTRLRGIVARLPPGLSEIYLHPATTDDFPGHAPGYHYANELAALLDSSVRQGITEQGIRLARFADTGAR